MSNRIIQFRVRPVKDDDIAKELEVIPSFLDRSEILREALRNYFFRAPTPLRDAYLALPEWIQAHNKIPEPKQVSSSEIADYTSQRVNFVADDEDIDRKLDKSLGF